MDKLIGRLGSPNGMSGYVLDPVNRGSGGGGMSDAEKRQLNKATSDIEELNKQMADRYTKEETKSTFVETIRFNSALKEEIQPRDAYFPYGSEVNAQEIIGMALNGITCNVIDESNQEFAIMSRVDMESYKLIFSNDKHLYTISLIDNSWEKVEALGSVKEEITNLKKEIEDIDGGVSDVKINNDSIVTDGMANLEFGGGLQVLTNKKIVISFGGDWAFQNRASLNAISTDKIDQLVRLAMCDGKGAEWTDDEKQKAQERLGILSVEEVLF